MTAVAPSCAHPMASVGPRGPSPAGTPTPCVDASPPSADDAAAATTATAAAATPSASSPGKRERTPAAPQEFEEFLALYADLTDVADERLLTVLDRLLRAYSAPAAASSASATVAAAGGTAASPREANSDTAQYEPTPPQQATRGGGGYTGGGGGGGGGGRPFTGLAGLRGLPQALQLCSDRVAAGQAAYTRPLLRLLRRLEEPLNLADVRDDRRQRQAVLRTIDAVAATLEAATGSSEVRVAAARVIRVLVSDIRTKGFDDITPPPVPQVRKRDTRFKCLTQCEAVPALCRHLGRSDLSPEEALLCLQAVLDCSCYRSVVARLVGEADGLSVLVELLRRTTAEEGYLQDARVCAIVEAVWNMCDLQPECRRLLGTERHLSTFYTVFSDFLKAGYRLKDKELRNDLLTVMSMVAGDSTTHAAFLATGWVDLILVAGCGVELCAEGREEEQQAVVKPFATTTSGDDFDMKKLLWHMTYLLSFTEESLRLSLGRGVMRVFVSYLDPACSVPSVLRWPSAQWAELQAQALTLIGQLCVGGADELRACGGVRTLLCFLEEHAASPLREATLRVLMRVATTANRTEVARAGALRVLLGLACASSEVAMRCDSLHVLAGVADGDAECRAEFADEGGIDVILGVLREYIAAPAPRGRALDHLIFAAIDCVWCCVIGLRESEMSFIQSEGVHLLMDVLVAAPEWIGVSLLSCVEDFLSSNSLAVAEMLDWKSPSGLTAPQVLIRMWGDDDEHRGKPSTSGLLSEHPSSDTPFVSPFGESEVERVLGGADAAETTAASPTAWDDAALFEATSGQLRPATVSPETNDIKVKIYCIFKRAIPPDSPALLVLSDAEKVRLQVVLSYASLKRDEVWARVVRSLKESDTVPIGLDRKRIDLAHGAAEDRWARIRDTQLSLAASHQARLDSEENTFYKLLVKKTEAAHVAPQATGLSITEAKIRKAQMLKQSFLNSSQSPDAPAAADGKGSQAASTPQQAPQQQPNAAAAAPVKRGAAAPLERPEELANEVAELISDVRAHPGMLVEALQKKLAAAAAETATCVEGSEGLRRAVAYLEAAGPVGRLCCTRGMVFAARDCVAEAAAVDATPLQRTQCYGISVGEAAESVALGACTAVDIVCALIVGDGVDSKCDRVNLFNPAFKYIGVACADHAVHRYRCVILYAEEYQNKTLPEQEAIHARSRVNPTQ